MEVKVDGAIIVLTKRGENPLPSVKTHCQISDRESDDPNNYLQIDCSQVPGPVRKLELEKDGYLRLSNNHFVAPSQFCVLKGNPNSGKLCPTHSDPLWRKCCGENELLDSNLKCHRSRIKFRPKVKDAHQSFTILRNTSKSRDPLFCGSGFMSRVYSSLACLPESTGRFELASNGTPMYQASTGVFLRKVQFKPVDQDSYCVDGLLDFSSCLDDDCQSEMGEVLIACFEELDSFLNENGDEKGIRKAYFFVAIWLSTCPLLVSAAIANSCVIQKNVHGWILTSYLISMFLVNINSVILILDVPSPSSKEGCGLLDFTMKFIYMSTLCWMTSMNFGLWRTFSSSLPHPQVVEPQRFILSAVFSLGFPVVSVSISYYMGSPDSPPISSNNNTKTFSQTCGKTCPLYSYKTLPYYSGPIILLVLCNVLAFLKTSTTIASLRRQAEAVLHKQTKDHLESFTLFAKLFLLTGSIWVIRVVLLVLQIQGLYVTWYGVALEACFSIPEVVFPMIIFHHPEFIKWAWRKSPMISRMLVKCNPFCKKDFYKEGASIELQSQNQMSSGALHHQVRRATSNSFHHGVALRTDPTTSGGAPGLNTITITTFDTNAERTSPEA